MISNVAVDHPRSWTKYLGYVLWALPEVPNETTWVPPWLMVNARIPQGHLAVLKENWTGFRDMPQSLGQTTVEYLNDLRQNLEIASSYATEHGNVNSNGIFHVYNLRAREKSFAVGEHVLILIRDSTSSKVFSRWLGPANVVEKKSPHSYINVKNLTV